MTPNETPTPLTDQQSIRAEAAFRAGAKAVVTADFARALERRNAELEAIITNTLKEIPVGYIPTHTAENLPRMVGDLVTQLADEDRRNAELVAALKEAHWQVNHPWVCGPKWVQYTRIQIDNLLKSIKQALAAQEGGEG